MNQTTTQPRTSNRRLSQRRHPKRSTKPYCYPNALGLGRNIALAVLDVSETGARLMVREALEPGREVEVGLEGLGHRRPVKCTGRVIWSLETAEGTYCVGIHFQRALPYADLLQLANI
jgi:hypothetical protein